MLDLQAEDTALKRLEEQKRTLPEAARLEDLRSKLEELEADVVIARKQRDEAAREQARIEGEVELISQKMSREEGRLLSGKVSNPKELANLQAEVALLTKKRAGIEDGLLEVMVQRDEAEKTLTSLETEREQTAAEVAQLTETVRGLNADLDEDTAKHREARQAISPQIPADVLSMYEKIRVAKGGVGAAALQGGTCLGCHTKLPAREAERLRSEGGLQRCDNCRRILVAV